MINLNNNVVIKQLYDKISEQLLLVYENMIKNPSFNMDKNDILISFDAYFQSVMIKAVLHKRNFEVGEINYIKNIVKFSDYYSKYNIIRDTYPSKEIEEALYKESSDYICRVPEVAAMSILIDHEIESSILKSSITFSKMLYNCFYEVATMIIDDTEDSYADVLLTPLKDFFARHHVLEFE